jgi:hypothetical protein
MPPPDTTTLPVMVEPACSSSRLLLPERSMASAWPPAELPPAIVPELTMLSPAPIMPTPPTPT